MIRLTSNILDRPWANNPAAVSTWLHLVLNADEYGQVMLSRAVLAKAVGISIQQVRTGLQKLASAGDIEIKSRYVANPQSWLLTNHCTIVTICNFECYKGDRPVANQPNQPVANQLPTLEEIDLWISESNENQKDSNNEGAGENEAAGNDGQLKEERSKEEKDINNNINNNNTQRKENKEKKPSRQTLDLSFIPEEIRPKFEEFLKMRRMINKPVKTMTGLRARWNTLMKLSDENMELASKIIDQSVSNEWMDFYALKTGAKAQNPEPAYSNEKYW